jgi:hypothetical protein
MLMIECITLKVDKKRYKNMNVINELNGEFYGVSVLSGFGKQRFSEKFREEVSFIQGVQKKIRSVEAECKLSEVDMLVDLLGSRDLMFFEYSFNMDEDQCSFDLYLKNVEDEDEEVQSEYIKSWIVNIDPTELEELELV